MRRATLLGSTYPNHENNSVLFIADANLRGMLWLASTGEDRGSALGGAFLFLDPVVGTPEDPKLLDEANRRTVACRRWLDALLRTGNVDIVPPRLTAKIPFPFVFAMNNAPGVVHMYRPPPVLAFDARSIVLWANRLCALGGMWSTWADAEMPSVPSGVVGEA